MSAKKTSPVKKKAVPAAVEAPKPVTHFNILLTAQQTQTIHSILMKVSMPAEITLPLLHEIEAQINKQQLKGK